MNPLLEQFLAESRESLQSIGEKLLALEKEPDSSELLTELFRLVHTLKGNSGLFDLPELTRVLHAGEDLMDAVRGAAVAYSPLLADRLLDAMDFVGLLCDELELHGRTDAKHIPTAVQLAEALRSLQVAGPGNAGYPQSTTAEVVPESPTVTPCTLPRSELPEEVRMAADRRTAAGEPLHWIAYHPDGDCFFQGIDPFFLARQTPGILWGNITPRKPWPELAQLDIYCSVLDFGILTTATENELEEYYRYASDQISIIPVSRRDLEGSGGVMTTEVPADGTPEQISRREQLPEITALLAAQREILALPDDVVWLAGRIKGAATSLAGCLHAVGAVELMPTLDTALEGALALLSAAPLLLWMDRHLSVAPAPSTGGEPSASALLPAPALQLQDRDPAPPAIKFGRRREDSFTGGKSIKVDQARIDQLLNLIGEMVVAKNALPYLADRAETTFGVRELSREIKSHYAVINRITQEMQESIMQVSMMPISFIFQRFPRLVRDTSQKLGKEVNLILEGEGTEADKHVIESLGEPLVHIVRNSLDHGIELPEVRRALGKPASGTIIITAAQESDRVVIEIRDDGKGIDPEAIKRSAYGKGIINEERLERISDQEAVNLVFASGLSTADVVSDLSGRGVGMDVVRTAVEKINGAVTLESEVGKGTLIRLSVPLSMAITNVMVVESNKQTFGVPMESVLETVRIPRDDIHTIKKCLATVRRGRIVPLKALNSLLGLNAPPKANGEDELAVLIVTVGGERVGIMVDDFHRTVEIILKPMSGVLAGLPAYSGSALLGDGSVLMVLDLKEIL